VSEYPEYEQLQELRAEDHRRRALAGFHIRVDDRLSTDLRISVGELGFRYALLQLHRQLLDAQMQANRLRMDARHPLTTHARWHRRRITRIAHQYDAIARSARRDLVVLQRPARPVIKKGLTR
jgi:predicted subunit of tRNA(5-methylaminomethyl-2-thiouridylate) methyltransferase